MIRNTIFTPVEIKPMLKIAKQKTCYSDSDVFFRIKVGTSNR